MLKNPVTLIKSAVGALRDPLRQDLVAAVGEITSTFPTAAPLHNLRDRMLADSMGRLILKERPLVSTESVELDSLRQLPKNTFGYAYTQFLDKDNLSPDARAPVKYIDPISVQKENKEQENVTQINEQSELAYVMLRYRQTHDFLHTLTNVPITVRGELALKWFEFAQTGIPMTLLAGLFGPPVSSIIPKPSNLSFPFSIVAQSITNTFGLQKDVNEWQGYWDKDVLWGIQAGSSASFLMNVYFEKEFNRDLNEFRDSLGIRVYNE